MTRKALDAGRVAATIPAQILARDDLSFAAKSAFGCVYALAISHEKCFISNTALGERMGIKDPRYVRRLLKSLEAKGLIERRPDTLHHRDEITIVWQPGAVVIGKRAKRPRVNRPPGVNRPYPPGQQTLGVGSSDPGPDSLRAQTDLDQTERVSRAARPPQGDGRHPRGERRGSIPTGEYCDAVDRAKRLFGQDIGPKVKDAADVYGSAWVAKAIDAAEAHGALNWGYALKCLERWQELGGIPEPKSKRKAEPKRPCDMPYDGPPPPAPDAIPPVEAGARIREIMAGADTSQAKSAT